MLSYLSINLLVDHGLDPDNNLVENKIEANHKIRKSIIEMIIKYRDGNQSQQAKGNAIEAALDAAIKAHSDFTKLGKPFKSLVSDADHALWKLETAMQRRVGFGACLKGGDSKAYKEVLQVIKNTLAADTSSTVSSRSEKV